jgi:hypothetical protein
MMVKLGDERSVEEGRKLLEIGMRMGDLRAAFYFGKCGNRDALKFASQHGHLGAAARLRIGPSPEGD